MSSLANARMAFIETAIYRSLTVSMLLNFDQNQLPLQDNVILCSPWLFLGVNSSFKPNSNLFSRSLWSHVVYGTSSLTTYSHSLMHQSRSVQVKKTEFGIHFVAYPTNLHLGWQSDIHAGRPAFVSLLIHGYKCVVDFFSSDWSGCKQWQDHHSDAQVWPEHHCASCFLCFLAAAHPVMLEKLQGAYDARGSMDCNYSRIGTTLWSRLGYMVKLT